MKELVFLMTLLFSAQAFTQSTVPSNFWGIQLNQTSSTFPDGLSFQTFRFWDTNPGTSWVELQDKNGAFHFNLLDAWMTNVVIPNHLAVIYTIGRTPSTISWNQQGTAFPPASVTCTGGGVAGTGGDDHDLINFVTALWQYIHNTKHWDSQRQWYFETWNEPDNSNFWNNDRIKTDECGGDATTPRRILARMASDIRTTLKNLGSTARFLSPPPSSVFIATKGSWWYNYLNGDGGVWGLLDANSDCSGYDGNSTNPCGGGQFADNISFHGYLGAGSDETPDDICCDSLGSNGKGTGVYNMLKFMAQFGQASKPLFITEASWGLYCPNNVCPSGFDPVAYTGRYYTLLASTAQTQVQLFAWYNYEGLGPLWCKDSSKMGCANNQPNTLSPSGIALDQMQNVWHYAGAKFNAGGCQIVPESGCSVQVCNLTEGNSGTVAQAVWNSAWPGPATCSYTPSVPPPNWVWHDYRDLAGDPPTGYTSGPVSVGVEPILFEAIPTGPNR
jgi:hypothetical protein